MTFNGSEADDQSICNGAIRKALHRRALTRVSDGVSGVTAVKIGVRRLLKEFPRSVTVGWIDEWADWRQEPSCGLRFQD